MRRFMEKVERRPDGCWQWTGYINDHNGQPTFRYEGRAQNAARVAHLLFVGPVDGLRVLHSCGNRECVNPEHLHTDAISDVLAHGYRETEAGCWEWTGTRMGNGYGRIVRGSDLLSTHRLAYEQAHGPIPEGMLVCHTCDNPPCINPAHLFLGDYSDNMVDMVEKGRNVLAGVAAQEPARGEDNPNSKLTEDQVRTIRAAHAAGESAYSLAKRFPVSKPWVLRIVRGEVWTHIPRDQERALVAIQERAG